MYPCIRTGHNINTLKQYYVQWLVTKSISYWQAYLPFKEKYTIFLALGRSIQETKQSIETISNLIKNTTTEKITQFKDVEGRDIELSIKNGYADAKVNGFSVGITFDKHTIKRMLNNLNKKKLKRKWRRL